MRVVVLLCLLTVPMLVLGWPSPWVVVVSAFAAGFLARRAPVAPSEERRPGYMPGPAPQPGDGEVARRVRMYTGPAPFDPQAFGVQLERPEFGDCEGCGGS